MVLVFWQGIISIHQQSFLEALAKQPSVSKVLLVVEEEITPYRRNMGWDVPEVAGVEIVRSPSAAEIGQIVNAYIDAVHIMGGIRVGRMMKAAFDVCIKHKCKVGIMTEPYNKASLKGRLRAIKYQYYRLRYFRHIQFVLAIGKQGVAQYAGLGFDAQFIFPWAYFMSLGKEFKRGYDNPAIKRIIYGGRLEAPKGIYRFAAELMNAGSGNFVLDIYGTGEDEGKLKGLATANNRQGAINFFPFLKYEDLLKKYAEYDWVVLPSTQKDGWGAIISEGLLNGLKAICSSICGVSWVIKEGYNGVTFDWAEEGSCKAAINKMLHEHTFAAPESISLWANKAISGNAGAVYFLQILDCVYHKKEKPGIPWIIN